MKLDRPSIAKICLVSFYCNHYTYNSSGSLLFTKSPLQLGALKVSGKHSVVDYCNELSRKSEDMCLWSPSTRHQGLSHHIESTPTIIPLTPITRVSFRLKRRYLGVLKLREIFLAGI